VRVLHLTPEYPPVIWGGLGTAVGGLVTASAASGITVGVLLVGGVLVLGQGESTDSNQSNIIYGQVRPAFNRLMATSLPSGSEKIMFFHVSPAEAADVGVYLAQKWKPDVVHVHAAWLWHVASAIREATGASLVFTVHSLDRIEYEHGVFLWSWEAQESAISAADRVIALSNGEAEQIAKFCPLASSKIRVVGNGISDTSAARQSAQKNRSARPALILYSGRFVNRKGIRELLGAIPRVLGAEPETKFVLVGGYGGGAEIERAWLIDVLQPYRHQVHFTGWLTPDEVARWYGAADILVVPSWYEPFGMVVLEGMLYGLAIAATNLGGPAEILQHQVTAVLFPPRDAEALANALIRLLAEFPFRASIAAAAAAEVRRNWLWPQVIRKMRCVYEELVLGELESQNLALSG
jgi:glycogen synthase